MPEGSGVRKIDWSDILRRLEASKESLQRSDHLSLDERKTILKSRARELARAQGGQRRAGDEITVVELLLAHERYAVEVSHVREACFVKDITVLPGVAPFVVGIVCVRGRILSVIDLKKFFDLPIRGLADLNRLVILNSGQMEIGILVDAIVGVRSVVPGELQPTLPTLSGARQEYLKGIAPDGLIVLDAPRLLSDKRIVVHEDVF